MKKCKKIILLVIILLVSMISNVYADESSKKAEVTLTSDKTSAKIGENVTILVSASHENGIECIDSVLKYDETKIKLEKVEMKNDFSDQSGTDGVTGEYIFTALFSGNENPTEVECAELTFKVLEEATVGEELKIELLNVYVIDTDIEKESVGNKEITLVVTEDKEIDLDPEPEPELDPDPNPDPEPQPQPQPESNPDKLPQTGKNSIISLFIIIIIASIIFYTRIRKYRDIK